MKEKVVKKATLIFLVDKTHVILARKTRHIGKGCRNGYGGGIKKGESPEGAAIRELDEEGKVKVDPKDLEKVAQVYFHNTKRNGHTFICLVHVYLVRKWIGTPQPTKEMILPRRFAFNKLPFGKMLPADKVWLPIILSGKKILAKAYYGPFQKELLREVEIKEVDAVY